ncbi:phosphatase PAP2 family protein [Candidatus Protochlamydia phocaeensis]|uniref:phosphatase PAP2 family protein n=1 Tax=Candidatus Protochlamydia phocaeensis TaxID=1414722 RepID=UPI0009ABFC58|nr:phosphatase PAP2 family protein [Candidatus Protochlamydia phocaeensis]
MLHAIELEFIHFIHQFRQAWSDQLFKWLNVFDRPEFFFFLIPILWLGQGWRTGLRLFYILLLSSLFNQTLKEFFQSPRPFHLDPHVGIIQVGGFGFPSGAAQTVMLLSGILLNTAKSNWKWLIAATYIILVSFSRVYLGVHFPSDILAGWLVGVGLWAAYTYLGPLIERQLEVLQPISLLLLSQTAPIVLFILHPSLSSFHICSVAMGLGLGAWIAYSRQLFLSPPASAKEYTLRAVIGVASTFACEAAISLSFPSQPVTALLFRFFLLGFWVSLVNPIFCLKLLPSRFFVKSR